MKQRTETTEGDEVPLYFALRKRNGGRPLREFPRLISRSIGMVRQAARRELHVSVVLSFASGAVVALQLLFAQRLIAKVVELGDTDSLSVVALPLVGFVVTFTIAGVLGVLQLERRRILAELVSRHAEAVVAAAASEADLTDFDVPRFHNHLRRALSNAGFRPVTLTFALINLISGLVSATAVFVALVVIEPVIAILVLVAVGPLWIGTKKMTRLGFLFDLEETEADRRRAYFLYLLTDKRAAKELRAYELSQPFIEQHRSLWDSRIVRVRENSRARTRISVVSRVVNSMLLGGVVLLLIWLVTSGHTTLASATVVSGSILLLGQRLSSVASSVGDLYECSLFLSDVEDFIAAADVKREQRGTASPSDPFRALELRGVSFTYPTGTSPALEDVSITVRNNEVVALVGANGSGKTTLAKLIAQLFQPSAGTALWNDEDVLGLNASALRSRIGVIFQDFERYHFTVAENIGFGRYGHRLDRQAVERAAEMADVREFVERFPSGFDSLLGPEYIGGKDLSVGQWQRLAVARAFFREAQVIVLDEPSSALDPEAETQLFERLRALGSGKGVVVVSHRFSTVRSADRILVLDRGRVIEEGPHDLLMALDGEYARLFRLQAAHYMPDEPGAA